MGHDRIDWRARATRGSTVWHVVGRVRWRVSITANIDRRYAELAASVMTHGPALAPTLHAWEIS